MKYALLLIPTEGLFYYLGFSIQSLPLINIFAIIFLFKNIFKKTKISHNLIYLYLYLILITTIYFNIDFIFNDKDRFIFFIRQFVSLTFGLSLFFFIRTLLLKYSTRVVLNYIFYSYYIVLLFAIISILQGNFFRITSIFTEPSHFGQYLVFIILPILMIMKNKNYINNQRYLFLFTSVFLLIILTFSFTTVLKFILLFVFLYLYKNKNWFIFFGRLLFFFILIIFLYQIIKMLYPDNYMFNMTSDILNKIFSNVSLAEMPLSLLDRLNFWIALFHSKFNLQLFFGYGIAGDYIYGQHLLPYDIYEKISLVKAVGFNMGSFMGKIFSYGGIVGLISIVYIFYKSIKLQSNSYIEKAILSSIFIYSTIGIGVFTMIPIWFWLAYVDAKQIKYKWVKS